MSTAVQYCSYAKINLYLDVLDKRPDGYNNIETIFQTVSLCDTLSFSEEENRLTLTASSRELDTGEGNLIYQAALLLQQKTGTTAGARIHLEKRIPIAAGLAGGSGNAAATLLALNVLWGLRMPIEELRAMALEIGSDVPYCTLGGAAAATQRGEKMTPLPAMPRKWFVLLHPPIAISASHTYNHPALGRNTEKPIGGKTPSFQQALDRFAAGKVQEVIFNRMDAPVFEDHPQLRDARDQLLRLGCKAAAISGSGPTLFGLCSSKKKATAIAEAITRYDTSVVYSVPYGVDRIA